MNDIIFRIQYIALVGLGKFSAHLSHSLRQVFGRFLGDCMRLASSRRRTITSDNLRLVFPTKSQSERDIILRKSYQNLGITFLEFFTTLFLKPEEVSARCHFSNLDLVRSIRDRGKGVILLTAHFGNWEWQAFACGFQLGVPILGVVKAQRNPLITEFLFRARTNGGNHVVEMAGSARHSLRRLQENGCLGILADQSAVPGRDIAVNFLGHPAMTYEAPAAFSLRTGAPLVMGLSKREANGTNSTTLVEIDSSDLSYSKEGIAELTRRHVAELEKAILANPELWSWQHRRWKYRDMLSVQSQTAEETVLNG